MDKYKTIDLCAGIGGIRRGFELTGRFCNVLSAEIDRMAAKTYEHLFGDDPKNDLTSKEFKEKVKETEYDVLLGGFPCQTFSSAGKQLGFEDKIKGTLFFDIAEIIRDTRPMAVFLENVQNLVIHDNGKTIATIIQTLEDELKYYVVGIHNGGERNDQYRDAFVRNSKYFGVPQNRPRTYIMAFNREIFDCYINSLDKSLPRRGGEIHYCDVNDILEPVVDDRYYISEGYLETLKKHKQRQHAKGYGFGYSVLNREGIEHPIAHTILATGGSGKERNLIWQPKDGVAGKIVSGKKTPLNSEGIRFMTPLEWARLQGFAGYGFINKDGVDTFGFPDGMPIGQQYKQLGNSVTIPVIKTMADFMLECLDLFDRMKAGISETISEEDKVLRKRSYDLPGA